MREQTPVGEVFPISPSVFRFPEQGEDPTHYLYDSVYWDSVDWNKVKGGMGPDETAVAVVILDLKEIWDGNPGYTTVWNGSGWFIFDSLGHRIARVDGIFF